MDAESAHELALLALRLNQRFPSLLRLTNSVFGYSDPSLEVSVAGLHFANPIGLAAGFDKNGVAVEALAALGFGHIEVGTVTPLPQAGQPRPRILRLAEDGALINRMGFPGRGMDSLARSLTRTRPGATVLGINVGANAASVQQGHALDDYVAALRRLAPLAHYLIINVSSPNTPLLRELQGPDALAALLGGVLAVLNENASPKPLFVKIAPDLSTDELEALLQVLVAKKVAGVVATNTTVTRPETLRSRYKSETGGLSGKPLHQQSTAIIRDIFRLTKGQLPIIGVGGVFTWQDALEKLLAGASLVQVYTGLVYRGPLIARSINEGLVDYMNRDGVHSLKTIVGTGVK